MKLSRIQNKSIDELLKSFNELKNDDSKPIDNNKNSFQISIEKWNEEAKKPAHKIRIPRWMSNHIAEYNSSPITVDNIGLEMNDEKVKTQQGNWKLHEVKMKTPFFAFSRTVYLPNNDFLVIGGLNDIVKERPYFTDQVIKISEVVLSPLQNFYVANQMPFLIKPRGWFASIYHEEYVYVFGGFNYDDREIRFSERLNIPTSYKWERIQQMTQYRK